MIDSAKIIEILAESPSIELLKLRNREVIIEFLVQTFYNQQGAIASETLHTKLSDFLEFKQLAQDEESEIEIADSYEIKAKKYIRNWTNSGYLTNYQDETGDVYYELSAHASKTFDWLSSLEKQEYVGAESKFKNIFNQLKELVEFTNEDIDKRIQILEARKKDITQQIRRLKRGEDVKVFEDYEIVPRFNQLNQNAKELLSDFKEVEDNFKEITKEIYRKHADGSVSKSHILEFTFDALDELKDSHQGKSFYAFWSFLLNPTLQEEWAKLTTELYSTLEKKEIAIHDFFLKGMKNLLHHSGRKVYKANDRMADKLSRIIRENEAAKYELTKSIAQDIKTLLIEISKKKRKQNPKISFELETKTDIFLPFERKLTFEQKEEVAYTNEPTLAQENLMESTSLDKLFNLSIIDKDALRLHIKKVLKTKSQTTLHEVIAISGGIKKGLPELFGYFGIIKEFKHLINDKKTESIIFDAANKKSIQVPEVILSK